MKTFVSAKTKILLAMVGAVFRKPAKLESGSCRVIWTDAMGQRSISGPYITRQCRIAFMPLMALTFLLP